MFRGGKISISLSKKEVCGEVVDAPGSAVQNERGSKACDLSRVAVSLGYDVGVR